MKKILITLFVIVGSCFVLGNNVKAAEEEFIELYPYDNILSMDENSNFTGGVKVGTSNWSFTYGGYRYHSVRGSVRYANDFEDKDLDGFISAAEMNASLSWNAFGSIIINETDKDFTLSTANGRTDLTSVVHRIWTYFNEKGELDLFEDQINKYWIVNEGDKTPTGQNWRLATDEEVLEYKAKPVAELPENVLNSHIRLKMDSKNTKGYVLEPIEFIKWSHLFKKDDAEHPASIILDATANVDYPTIKAGYTVISYGTKDRDGANKKAVDFILSMPKMMTQANKLTMTKTFIEPKPSFGTTLTALDKDAETAGINYIIDHKSEFTTEALIGEVAVTHMNMFDKDGKIINEVNHLPYEIRVVRNGIVEETIKVTYNAETKKYTADKNITKVDTNIFGQGFTLEFVAVSPNDATNIQLVEVDLAVGVIPPKFVNVPRTPIYSQEGVPFIDLLGKITANNSYGLDLTETIKIDAGKNFNPYNPKPGLYDIKLSLEYTHVIDEETNETHTFEIETSYKLQIDDVTKPVLHVRNNTLTVKAGQFTNADELIKGNIIATDNFSDVALIIESNGGLELATAGTYEITVSALDEADNESEAVKFTIIVEEVPVDKVPSLEKKITTNLILTIVLSTVLSGAALGAAILILKKK